MKCPPSFASESKNTTGPWPTEEIQTEYHRKRLFPEFKLFSDEFHKTVFDLRMTGNRSLSPRFRVNIAIRFLPVPPYRAPGIKKFPDELASLHTSMGSSFVFAPDCGGDSSSKIRR